MWILRLIAYVILLVFGYFLMFIVMSYNAAFFIAVILGHTFGFVFFQFSFFVVDHKMTKNKITIASNANIRTNLFVDDSATK